MGILFDVNSDEWECHDYCKDCGDFYYGIICHCEQRNRDKTKDKEIKEELFRLIREEFNELPNKS